MFYFVWFDMIMIFYLDMLQKVREDFDSKII